MQPTNEELQLRRKFGLSTAEIHSMNEQALANMQTLAPKPQDIARSRIIADRENPYGTPKTHHRFDRD